MSPAKSKPSNKSAENKGRGEGLKHNIKKLEEIVNVLKDKKFTKEELAEKIGVDKVLLTEGVFLAAAKHTKNIEFMDNFILASPGKSKVPPRYIEKKGLLIQPSHFKNVKIENYQQYHIEINEDGTITLKPTKAENSTEKI